MLYTAIFEESTPTEKNKVNALYTVLPLGGALAGIAGTILLGKLKKRKGVEDEETLLFYIYVSLDDENLCFCLP